MVFSRALACTWSGGCVYLSSFVHVWTLGRTSDISAWLEPKISFFFFFFFISLCRHGFTLTSCKIIELILTHVLSSLLSIYGMDFTPYISLLDKAVILVKQIKSFIYRMHSTATCFRIGKVCFRRHTDLRRVRSINRKIKKKIEAALYHSLSCRVLSYCDLSTSG